MKKKSVISLTLALVLVLLNVVIVFANPYSVAEDTWVDGSSNNYDATGSLKLFSSSTGTCTPTLGTLLQVDMTQIVQDTVATATLEVVVDAISISNNVTLELFAATADFDETTAGGPLAGWKGSSLGSTITVPPTATAGTVLTFPTTAAFAAHMETARQGDGKASVVILISQCGTGAFSIDLDEKETGTAAVFNFWNPTAVKLERVEASSGSVIENVVWSTLLVFSMLMFVGLFIYRRSRQA